VGDGAGRGAQLGAGFDQPGADRPVGRPVAEGQRLNGRPRPDSDEPTRRIHQKSAEAVVRAQAPDEANVDVPFGETVGAVSRAAEDENVDLIVVGSEDKGFLRPLFGGWSQKISRASPRDRY
jgi:nucleotide-binding universal stress UspA family protein